MHFGRYGASPIIAALLGLTACSKHDGQINQVETIIKSSSDLTNNPTLEIGTEGQGWADLNRPGRTIGVFELGLPCGGGNNGLGDVKLDAQNFHGNIIVNDKVLGDRPFIVLNSLGFLHWKTIAFFGPQETRIFHCSGFSDKFLSFSKAHPDIVSGGGDSRNLVFAKRQNLNFDYAKSYETDSPEHGKVLVVATTFTYDLVPTVPNLRASAKGSGTAKAFMNNDTGKWTFTDFEMKDPDLIFDGVAATSFDIDPVPPSPAAAPTGASTPSGGPAAASDAAATAAATQANLAAARSQDHQVDYIRAPYDVPHEVMIMIEQSGSIEEAKSILSGQGIPYTVGSTSNLNPQTLEYMRIHPNEPFAERSGNFVFLGFPRSN